MRILALVVAVAVLAAVRNWRLIRHWCWQVLKEHRLSCRHMFSRPSKAAWIGFGQDVLMWAGFVYICETMHIDTPKINYVALTVLAAYRATLTKWPDFELNPRSWLEQAKQQLFGQEPESGPPEEATADTTPVLHLVKPESHESTQVPRPQSDDGFSTPQIYHPGQATNPS